MGFVQDMTNGAAIDAHDNCLFIHSRPFNDIKLYHELQHCKEKTGYSYNEEFYDLVR
jgi:hypothetical protein